MDGEKNCDNCFFRNKNFQGVVDIENFTWFCDMTPIQPSSEICNEWYEDLK